MTTAHAITLDAPATAGLVIVPPLALPNPAELHVASMSTEDSRDSVRWAMRAACRLLGRHSSEWNKLPWHSIEAAHLTGIRTRATELYAPSSANLLVTSLRGTLKSAWRQGQMDQERLARLLDTLDGISGEREDVGRALSLLEQHKLLSCAAQGKGLHGPRDLAMIAVMLGCGLRRAEVTYLTLASWRPDSPSSFLRVRGKGNKEKDQPVPPTVQRAIVAWLERRGDDAGPLFPALAPSGHHWIGRALTGSAVHKRLGALGREAGIGVVHPHDLRRTYATSLLENHNDVLVVQQLMRHANPATTARYDKRNKSVLADAASRLAVPIPEVNRRA